MRELMAWLIAVNGFVAGIFLLRESAVDWKGFLVIAAACTLLAVVLAHLPSITGLVVKGGDVSVQITRQVERVETRAKEVEQMAKEVIDVKDQVRLLVQNANATNDKIQASEGRVNALVAEAKKVETQIEAISKQAQSAAEAVRRTETNVSQMRDQVRQTWQSLLESYVYAIGTRNLFPPPEFVSAEIDRHLNILAVFAYPDPKERDKELKRMMALIQRAQGGK